MPTVEKTAGAWVYIRALDRDFHIGDQADVGADLADYLVEERGDFAYVGERGDTAGVATADDDTEGAEDAFDVEAWLEQDYQDRASRVHAGEVDDHLDAIADAETSDTVRDAIGERRAELEP